jgi:hypothetical protein
MNMTIGLCATAPVNQPYSLLCLSNNLVIQDVFQELYDRCQQSYRVKVLSHFDATFQLSYHTIPYHTIPCRSYHIIS